MSLINDALKTAQRERSGRAAPGSSSQPLLEGFFPFVSTSSPSRRARSRVILIASISAVVVLAAGGFATMPAIRRALAARSRASTPPLKPIQTARNTATPPPVSPASPSQAATAPVDTTATGTVVVDPPAAPAERRSPRTIPQADPVVRSVDPTTTRSDTTIVRGGIQISQAPSNPPRDEPSTRTDYEAQATALFNAGDLAGARERFQLATRYAPTARAWTNYGVTLQKLGDLRAARAAYQAAIGIDASYLEAWLFNARIAMALKETQVAVPLLQRARSINPRHAGVNADLAQLESDAGNWTESRKFAEDALRTEPANPRGHWYLAIAADQMKDVDVAVREYTAYLQTIGTGAPENATPIGYARERLELLRKKP